MNAYVFDIDGVITDPVSKEANQDILNHIVKILENGEFVAFNTGRSFSWTQDKILSPLLESAHNRSIFKNMFIVCEKGNVLGKFQVDTFEKQVLDDPLPQALQEQMKSLTIQFSDSMFYDDSKETMISIEMKDSFDIPTYHKDQMQLQGKITEILNTKYVDLGLQLDTSHISLDIQYEDAGKHLGAERIEDFMLENGIKPDVIYMFGDSASDSEMAEELQGTYEVKFIYVGDKSKLDTEKLRCEIVFPEKKYTEGTIEFLEKNG